MMDIGKLRKIENGYIVNLRWPYGDEVYCSNLWNVFINITEASDEKGKDKIIAALQAAMEESEAQ